MKLISWNVNGIRACIKKGFLDFFNEIDADIMCLQETKISQGQIELELEGYHQYFNYAEKKGYSGTAIFSKQKALSIRNGIGIEEHDHEGRVITAEYDNFYLVNVYTPNSKRGLLRLDYRMQWEDDFRKYVTQLDNIKPVIICGDLNVAHKEIDIKNPKPNQKNAGFTIQERTQLSNLLEAGFIDSYRYFYPDKEGAYSWWSYMFNARQNNVGWRLDYFNVSKKLEDKLLGADILSEVLGSDHCPVKLDIDIKADGTNSDCTISNKQLELDINN